MSNQVYKRVTGGSLNQHLGKSVLLLGELLELESNGKKFTLKAPSNDIVTVQVLEPVKFMKHSGIIAPDLVPCQTHQNCYLKIKHAFTCLEPFICQGSNDCVIICETNSKKLTPKEFTWKNITSQTIPTSNKRRKNVVISAESNKIQIETFVKSKNNEVDLGDANSTDTALDPMLFADPDHRNSFLQFQRKEHMRDRLRNKYYNKYNLLAPCLCKDTNGKKVSYNFKKLLTDAENTFHEELLAEAATMNMNMHFTFCGSMTDTCNFSCATDSVFESLKTSILSKFSVAVSTQDVIFGRIISPSKKVTPTRLSPVPNNTDILLPPNSKNVKETENKCKETVDVKNDVSLASQKSKKSKTKKRKNVFKGVTLETELLNGLESFSSIEDAKDYQEGLIAGFTRGMQLNIEKVKEKISTEEQKVANKELEKIITKQNGNKKMQCQNGIAKNSKKENFVDALQLEGEDHSAAIVAETIKKVLFEDSASEDDTNKNKTNSVIRETDQDALAEKFLEIIGVKKPDDQETNDTNSNIENNSLVEKNSKKLRVCAYCQKKEEIVKTFKRCSRCKAENFPVQRYYCSRKCQMDDWEETHRDEHSKK